MADIESLALHRKARPTNIKGYIGNEKSKEEIFARLGAGKRPQVVLFTGNSGCGKAQPLDSLVLTTSGYKKMGDIKVGDEVFTHKGNRGRVSGIYPQGIRPIYRITLSDRTYIDVSDEHLNCVYYIEDGKRTDLVVNTLELVGLHNKCNYNLCIDTPSVDWCNSIEDTTRFGINGIPKDLLFSNKDTRMRLLNNLFSYYGVVVDGKVELNFNAIHGKKLSDDVAFLLRSLGIVDIFYEVPDLGYTHRLESNIRVNSNNVLIFDDSLSYIRYIESIERIDDQECQCIMVDHEDHTYISDFFIPTHNTTLARLLVKEYMCENRDEQTGACGCCVNCQMFDEYILTGSTDNLISSIREVNIADQSGKNDLTEVFDDMMTPSYGDWKAYIFDECHRASGGLQNKLLKIAEEPPEKVLIILCTTNPELLIDTLKNRCELQLQIQKPKLKELVGLLKSVCSKEGIEYDIAGLEFLANRDSLTIRSALVGLDRVYSSKGNAKYESVIDIFDAVSTSQIFALMRNLKKKDTYGYVNTFFKIKSSIDLKYFLGEFRNFIQTGIYIANGINVEGVSENDYKVYQELFCGIGVAEMSNLLTRVLSIDTNNIEADLLNLGYTGFDVVKDVRTDVKELEQIAVTYSDELEQEKKNANQCIKREEKKKFEQGVENAKNMMETCDISDILGFGGTLVD